MLESVKGRATLGGRTNASVPTRTLLVFFVLIGLVQGKSAEFI